MVEIIWLCSYSECAVSIYAPKAGRQSSYIDIIMSTDFVIESSRLLLLHHYLAVARDVRIDLSAVLNRPIWLIGTYLFASSNWNKDFLIGPGHIMMIPQRTGAQGDNCQIRQFLFVILHWVAALLPFTSTTGSEASDIGGWDAGAYSFATFLECIYIATCLCYHDNTEALLWLWHTKKRSN